MLYTIYCMIGLCHLMAGDDSRMAGGESRMTGDAVGLMAFSPIYT